MSSDALFGLSILMSFLAFAIVTKVRIWPRLRVMRRTDALIPLVIPHTFRFVGLRFLVPGVVSPSLSPAFAIPAAYGDLVAAILAGVATLALAARASWAIPIVQRVGRGRPLARNLPRPNRRGHCTWIAGSGVFHPDSRCPIATRYAWAHILAAAAAKAMKRRTNHGYYMTPGQIQNAG